MSDVTNENIIDQMQREIDALEAKLDHKQFIIDSLMLEYCPDGMTTEQWDERARHQVPAEGDT